MTHVLPKLPYAKDALKPVLSEETFDFHHGKHHQAYVNTLNTLIAGTEFENMELEEIIKKASGGIFNNAAQVWNHDFYWKCLTPETGMQPSGKLLEMINAEFGNLETLAENFLKTAVTTFGSGWAWLVQNVNGRLELVSTSNAANPMTSGQKPLLTCDVWEHAYYIDYRNVRPDYVKALWSRINWDFVSQNCIG